MKLSVAIIAKNEENFIGRCLESVKEADEIVVCDTGSEDKTIEVAKKYTDKVFNDYKWNDSFAEARNYAISKCTGDWILVVDCDCWIPTLINEIKKEIEKAEKIGHKTISLKICWENGKFSHWLPYLFKRDPEIYFKGAVHNWLTRDNKHYSDIVMLCRHSNSHQRDPNRSFRILKKVNVEDSNLIREKYYLAREYYYRRDYIIAIWWFIEYLKKAYYFAEMADANLFISKSYWRLNKGDLARAFCLEAINCDANYKEAIQFMAEMSGPNNRDRWLIFAETANDKFTLFKREPNEWTNKDYNDQFSKDSDMSRYKAIYEEIGKWVGDKKVLDIGCGVGELSKYIKHYRGFDFSEVAIKIAKEKEADVWVGDAYDKSNYKKADYYIATEVFEHLDDIKILNIIPKGQKIIFSIPSFNDPSHIKVFSEALMRFRYKDLIDIKKVVRFNWKDQKWKLEGDKTTAYILLVESIKK